jgi:cbb3-type cytochrome oxidase subunit 3
MPDSIVIMRAALMLALVVATVALAVWLMRPKVRRELDEAAMIPWREEQPPAAPRQQREDRR